MVCAGVRAGDEKGQHDQRRSCNLFSEVDHLNSLLGSVVREQEMKSAAQGGLFLTAPNPAGNNSSRAQAIAHT